MNTQLQVRPVCFFPGCDAPVYNDMQGQLYKAGPKLFVACHAHASHVDNAVRVVGDAARAAFKQLARRAMDRLTANVPGVLGEILKEKFHGG